MNLFKNTRLIAPALLGLITLFPASVGAVTLREGTAQDVELPTPRKIVDRYLDVSGTAEFAPKYQSQKITGTIELVGMGIKGTTEALSMKPGYSLTTVEMTIVGKIISGDDGKIAWRIHPMMGEQILEGTELGQLRGRNAPFVSPFKKKDRFEVMETVGKETFEKQECYKVRFVEKPYEGDKEPEKTKKIREFFEFYAVESGLLVGMTMISSSDAGDIPMTIVMSDYKQFGETKQPAKITIKAQGMEIVAETKTIEFNTIKDASVFEPPTAIKLLAEEEAKKAAGGTVKDGK